MSIKLLRTYRPALNSFTQTMRYNAFRTAGSKRCMSTQTPPSTFGKTVRRVVITLSLTGAGLYAMKILKDEKDRIATVERKRRLGTAIGGPYELVDQNNKVRTNEDFRGQWVLMYFGFTHCPDICPAEMEKMMTIVDIVDNNKKLPNIQPIFITVDPARDTPEIVGKYVEEFSPKIIALTGSKTQVANVCKAYRVFFNSGTPDEDNDYIVDHSIIIYLIDPDGEFVDYFGTFVTGEQVAQAVEFQMKKYEKMKNAWWTKYIPSYIKKNPQSS